MVQPKSDTHLAASELVCHVGASSVTLIELALQQRRTPLGILKLRTEFLRVLQSRGVVVVPLVQHGNLLLQHAYALATRRQKLAEELGLRLRCRC